MYDIFKQNKIIKTIIFSDSLSTLSSIKNYYHANDIMKKIQNQISVIEFNSQTIIMVWTPSHIGIQENDLADVFAKQAIASLDTEKSILKPFTILKISLIM